MTDEEARPEIMSAYNYTQAQHDKVQKMLKKEYRIYSLRFSAMSGHVAVAVRSGKATRYFWIGQDGQLIR